MPAPEHTGDDRVVRARRFGLMAALTAAAMVVSGCSADWGWYVVSPSTEQGRRNLEFLLGGFKYTLALSFSTIAISVAIGLIVALPGISTRRGWRAVNRTYVELFRAIPILVLLLWVYYGLPQMAGISLSVFEAGVIALALSDSAFQAEIFRAGIQSIERGQHEAAKSLALTYMQAMWLIVLPQALRRILPPLGNQFIYVLKMSSLVSVIGVSDLTRRANELVVTEYRPLEIYTALVIEYLVLVLVVSAGVRWLERKMAQGETH